MSLYGITSNSKSEKKKKKRKKKRRGITSTLTCRDILNIKKILYYNEKLICTVRMQVKEKQHAMLSENVMGIISNRIKIIRE